MSFLLDTNVWISYLKSPNSPAARRIEQADPSQIVLCAVVKAELFYGAFKSPRPIENLALLDRIFSRFVSLPFGDDAARRYGEIRAALESRGTPIGPNDLMIAASASANGAILVTHNTAEFSRIAGLTLDDWMT